jgi:hypothetical protein
MALCEPGKAHLAYFYFDFRDEKKQNARNLITSLLSQLSTFSDASCDVITLLYSTRRDGTQKPTDDDLTRCLKQMLSVLAEHPIYIVMDALDECPDDSGWPKTPREEVLDVVRDLVGVHLPNLRICVTSRPEVDIKSILNQLTIHAVSLHDQSEQQKGMVDYVSTIVNSDRKMRTWPDEDKDLVVKELSERADGMYGRRFMLYNKFLIVYCSGSGGLSASWRPCGGRCNEMCEGFFRGYPKPWMRHTSVS